MCLPRGEEALSKSQKSQKKELTHAHWSQNDFYDFCPRKKSL